MTTKSAKNDLTTISKAIGLPGKFTRTSWVPPDNLTYPEWLAAGRRIMDVRMATSWWVGDWWRSQEAYGQRVAIAREHLSLELETIRNYASVAARVSYRNETLTFTHHMPVAHMPPDSQRKWLEYAIEHSLSAKELRAEIEKAEALASQTHDSDASEDAASEISHPIDTENHESTQSANRRVRRRALFWWWHHAAAATAGEGANARAARPRPAGDLHPGRWLALLSHQ